MGEGSDKANNVDAVRQAFEPAIRRVLHFYWRFARAMTLGVRAVVIDREGRIFLVKHSYVSGWHLPGGGVEAGETITQALARELREEGNIELDTPARLFGMYFNDRDPRATTWRCSWCGISTSHRRRSPTTRSLRMASPPASCRATPLRARGRASARCSAERR